jgi:xanthine/CO dehydrogenase XdhC/CoxF family maturation factor
LLTDLESDAEKIRARLHAPVGLPIGGRSPESIALAIVGEIHFFVHLGATRAAPSLECQLPEWSIYHRHIETTIR